MNSIILQSAKQLLLFLLCVYWLLYSASSLVLLLFHTFISFGTLGWVLSEMCDLLYFNYRSCSLGFTAAVCPSLWYLHTSLPRPLLSKIYRSPSFFSIILLAICPIDNAPFQHVTVATVFSMIAPLCCPPVSSQNLSGWVRLALIYTVLDGLSNNCFIIINLFTSA